MTAGPDEAVHEAAPEAPPAASDAPARSPRGARAREVAGVVALLVALECLLFWGYFAGVHAPPWDFMGSYNTDAYVWWERGSFFDPFDWIPHAWGGYPAAASIQNSAWYLPVGVVAAITPFSIHASAALAALHYAFGAAGVYALGRAFGTGRAPAAFGLVAWFFVAGFYAQAEYVDIARGYAWLPWLLLATSPRWPWRRWWGVPLAALLLWQALLGTYPGMIVSAAYAVLAWVAVGVAATARPVRRYLAPLAVSGGLALALLAPKYVPVLLLTDPPVDEYTDASVMSWNLLATAFLPYGNPMLPTDIALRSFFLPATCFVLAGLAALRGRLPGTALARGALAALGVAVVLGLPSPWSPLVDALPGLTLSRFRLSDFRAVMLLAVCLLAMAALAQALAARDRHGAAGHDRWTRAATARAAWLVALPAGLLALALASDFDAAEWSVPVLLVTGACAVAAIAVLPLPAGLRSWALPARPAAVVLVVLTLVSGVWGAYATPSPWRSSRVFAETESFGASVDSLLARDADPGEPDERRQRPARAPANVPVVKTEVLHPRWNTGFYAGTDAVGGLVNLKRSDSFREMFRALQDPARMDDVNALFSAPGVVVAAPADGAAPPADDVRRCVETGTCGEGLTARPDGYVPGHLRYDVTAARDTRVVLNEAYYLGWRVRACDADGACRDLQAGRGPAGALAVDLPQGTWDLDVEYVAPGSAKAWLLFAAGAAALVGWAVLAAVLPRVRRRRRPRGARRLAPAADA